MKYPWRLTIENEPHNADGLVVFAKDEQQARREGYEYYEKRGQWFGIKITEVKRDDKK